MIHGNPWPALLRPAERLCCRQTLSALSGYQQRPHGSDDQKLKMVRRRTYGRAGLKLLTALLVLPWYYQDRDAQAQSQPIDSAAQEPVQ